MRLSPDNQRKAFTLLELLVVFGIMVVVAGLVVGLSGVAGEKKKVSRTQVEKERLVTLIEQYRMKVGVYPPQNPDPNKLGANTLLYELAGALCTNRSSPDPLYATPFGSILSSVLLAEFGVPGILNSSDDGTEIKRFLRNLKPDQYATLPSGAKVLAVPVDGPNGKPNLWNYLVDTNRAGTNVFHNRAGFDLWAEIDLGNKTNRIGNWKD